MSLLLVVGGAVVVGLASALVPLANAEAAAIGAGVTMPGVEAAFVVAALGLGQTLGKYAVYTGAVTAHTRARRRRNSRPPTHRAHDRGLSGRALTLIGTPLSGSAIVFCAAATGLPPLAVVSAAAGMARLPLKLFLATCLAGRILRFSALALVAATTT